MTGKLAAWCASLGKRMPSNDTSAYCQARSRLSLQCLRAIFSAIGGWICKRDRDNALLNGRKVRVVDGMLEAALTHGVPLERLSPRQKTSG